MEVALHSIGHAADARIAIVRSTLDLEDLWVSEALADEVAAHPRLRITSPPAGLDFDDADRLRALAGTLNVTSS
jgi:hypothetical protein